MKSLAAFALTLAAASPASAAVTVIGNSAARICYEAARSEFKPSSAIAQCNAAFVSDLLTRDDQIATYVNRGILRATRGDVAGAIGDYDAALKLDPRQSEAFVNKGFAYLRNEDPSGALPFFDAAVANDPEEPAVAYYGRATAHELSGNLRAAYADYVRARDLQPKWDQPRQELARFSVGRRAGSR